MTYFSNQDGQTKDAKIVLHVIGGIILLIASLMTIIPHYKVWSASQSGKAALSHAHYERQVQVVNAEANLEAQKLNAQSEVERAKGVQQANAIIADGLKGHEEYLRYLWITNLESGNNKEVIYVPTEAQIPILEAGKR